MTFHLSEFVFYFMTIVFLWYEFFCITNSAYVLSFVEKMKSKTITRLSSEESWLILIGSLYPLWGFIGLFSSQRILFIGLLGLVIIGSYIKKYHNALFVIWFKIDSIISVILLILIVLNKFYFKL